MGSPFRDGRRFRNVALRCVVAVLRVLVKKIRRLPLHRLQRGRSRRPPMIGTRPEFVYAICRAGQGAG